MNKILGLHEVRTVKFFKAVMCEFLATAILMVAGCGSSVSMDSGKPLSTLTTALTFGMTVAYIVWTFNHISGAHINPVVTISFLITGHVSVIKTIAYIVAQCAGAVGGSAIVWYMVPPSWRGTAGSTVFAEGVTLAQGFAIEVISSFILLLGVFATSDQYRTDHTGSMSLTIGLIVFMESAWAGKLTGCSMNPARTLGPAVMSGTWENHWVYWVAPAIGAVAGSLLYEHVLAESPHGADMNIEIESTGKSIKKSNEEFCTDMTIIVEANTAFSNMKEGFDNLALSLDMEKSSSLVSV